MRVRVEDLKTGDLITNIKGGEEYEVTEVQVFETFRRCNVWHVLKGKPHKPFMWETYYGVYVELISDICEIPL